MEALRGYSMEKVKALEKEGKAIVFRYSGVALIWNEEEERVFACTYDPGTGRFMKCYPTTQIPHLEAFTKLARRKP